jgi:nucleotide-binding universal stress UspA family protein
MLGPILVPLDGSPFGEHALPLALTIARRAGSELHLAHVHQPAPVGTIGGVALVDAVDHHLRQDEQDYLAGVARRVTARANVPVKTALLDGDVTAALNEHAGAVGAGLVVMSTHGRGAVGRFWLGSVADGVLREVARPVLLVRPYDESRPDLGREPALRNILVPLDGSDLAERILPPAVALAKLFEGSITLLRVVAPEVRPSFVHEGGVAGLVHHDLDQLQALQEQRRKEAQAYLERVALDVAAKGCKVRTRVVIDEQPALSILLEANASYADLIAMESHGRRGLSRLFLGSVADKVVRGAGAPVLLHRQPR